MARTRKPWSARLFSVAFFGKGDRVTCDVTLSIEHRTERGRLVCLELTPDEAEAMADELRASATRARTYARHMLIDATSEV
jgi:hypothetical protein